MPDLFFLNRLTCVHSHEYGIPNSAITKRTRSTVACDKCRERRGKVSSAADLNHRPLILALCDGDRPICRHCYRLGTPCVYATKDVAESRMQALKREKDTLQKRNAALEALLNPFHPLPQPYAHATLSIDQHRMRLQRKFLNSMEGNTWLLQPSPQQVALDLLP